MITGIIASIVMGSILNWQIGLIIWLQHLSPWLDWPFRLFTFVGEVNFLVILLLVTYWCIDQRLGIRLILFFLFATYLGNFIKVYTNQPRPFEYNLQVKKLADAPGKAFPSLHTLCTVAVWGYLASHFNRRWLWAISLLLLVFIPLSRIYLGVHFPTDVIGGYLIGGIILFLFLRYEESLGKWLSQLSFQWKLIISILFPGLLMLIFPTQEWAGVTLGALLLGISLGYVLEREFVKAEMSAPLGKQGIKLILGISSSLLLLYGSKIVSPFFGSKLIVLGTTYTLMGIWASLVLPWIFKISKLSGKS